MMDGMIVRLAQEKDYAFVFSTWCDSWRHESAPWVAATDWKRAVGTQVAARMRKGRLYVACDVDDEDRLYGWCCGKSGRLWWVYVRETRRGMGLGARLVEAVCGQVTSCLVMTPKMAPVAARKGVTWQV